MKQRKIFYRKKKLPWGGSFFEDLFKLDDTKNALNARNEKYWWSTSYLVNHYLRIQSFFYFCLYFFQNFSCFCANLILIYNKYFLFNGKYIFPSDIHQITFCNCFWAQCRKIVSFLNSQEFIKGFLIWYKFNPFINGIKLFFSHIFFKEYNLLWNYWSRFLLFINFWLIITNILLSDNY